ncbi:hypothetical protein PRIPAC_94974 [Pristionchus pacificus]|uniref:FERM domain containing protein n=1 Tax=Pristionchus pacificus TaxID=54126 RepID=A0A2A6BAB1_PRIPA|nr:hypothetical protein PRIPAC_94974 [Pristionchus pacificus]|eukprot:PDM62803.1 FERM domain containing protein [Pristionchus pacificus]
MRFGSGTYNVRDSEGLNPDTLIRQQPSSLQRTISCRVFFLDGTEHQFSLPRQARGGELLDRVYEYLEIVERDYFGLQFLSLLDPGEETQQKKWLDADKSIRKQMICPPYNLYFRVKFYVSDPSKLVEEYTRYHLFLQLRKDILDVRLPISENTAILLASYVVQSEFGDFSAEEHGENYLDGLVFAPHQPVDFGERVAALHPQHVGMMPADAEFAFIEHAKRLDLYGVELFECRDIVDSTLAVGANAFGIIVFAPEPPTGRSRTVDLSPSKLRKISEFPWSCIMKISFKRKQFAIEIRTMIDDQTEKDSVLTFHCFSSPACKALWKSCVEHHTFFRLIAPPVKPPKGLFNIGSRFRYSGRTEFQTMEDVKRRVRADRPFVRSSSKGSFARHTFAGGSGTRSTDSSRISSNEGTAVDSPDLSARVYSAEGPAAAAAAEAAQARPTRATSWARRLLFASASARTADAPGASAAIDATSTPTTSRLDAEADCEVVLALHKSTSLPVER